MYVYYHAEWPVHVSSGAFSGFWPVWFGFSGQVDVWGIKKKRPQIITWLVLKSTDQIFNLNQTQYAEKKQYARSFIGSELNVRTPWCKIFTSFSNFKKFNKWILTKHLSNNHPSILSSDRSPGVPLVGELDKGVALVDGAAYDLAVLGEDGLDVALGDQQGVEVADEDPGVEGALVGLVGDVAAGHQAGSGGWTTSGKTHTDKSQI